MIANFSWGIMESLIVAVLQSEYPDWDAPANTAEWVACCCPFHGDTHPSAGVSLDNDAFICHACGEKGDAIGLLAKMRSVNRKQAEQIAEELAPGSLREIQERTARKPRRRTFGQAGTRGSSGRIRSGVRRGTTAGP